MDADDARYNSFFWWRDFYAKRFHHHRAVCDLCARLHADEPAKTYADMNAWWVEGAGCRGAVDDGAAADTLWLQ